jgi:hypothetical protein
MTGNLGQLVDCALIQDTKIVFKFFLFFPTEDRITLPGFSLRDGFSVFLDS